jgi:Amt family ammonium transporter
MIVDRLAYNPGSATYTTNPSLATGISLAGTNTFLAASAGSLSALLLDTFIEFRRTGSVSYDLVMACNGALVGLVSISGCCALVPSWVSVVIGIVGGWVYYTGVKLLLHFRIDDAVDAIPAHLGGGTWGLLATGLFANPHYMQLAGYNSAHPGWFYSWARGSGDANLLLCEFCHFLYICIWVTAIMGPTFWILRRIGEFRVDEEDELRGLDHSFHGIIKDLPYDRQSYGSDQFRSSQFGSSQFGSSRGFHQYLNENPAGDGEKAAKVHGSPEIVDKMEAIETPTEQKEVQAAPNSVEQMEIDTQPMEKVKTEASVDPLEKVELKAEPVGKEEVDGMTMEPNTK